MDELKIRRLFFILSIPYLIFLAITIFLSEPLLNLQWSFLARDKVQENKIEKSEIFNKNIWTTSSSKEIPSPESQSISNFIIEFTNQYRIQNGFQPLIKDNTLSIMAYAHCRDMGVKGYFSHISPEGLTPIDRKRIYYSCLLGDIGENIFKFEKVKINDNQLAIEAVDGWMNSPSHRANILNSDFSLIGVGVFSTGDTIYITQNFSDAVAILDKDIPLEVKINTPLEFKGTLSKSKEGRSIDIFFRHNYRGFLKANVTDKVPINVQWLDDINFSVITRVEKNGIYELCISVDQKLFPGQPIRVI